MFIGPEKLAEMFGRGLKTGLAIKLPVGGCGGCPTRMCGSCPLRSATVTSEVSVIKPGNLTALGKLTRLENVATTAGVTGSLSFRPVGETVRPVFSEKTCSQCGKNPNTCHCERNWKAA